MDVLFPADSYRASILKAFSKTVEEGRFPFVILDAPNIQVEDFRPFYMAAQVPHPHPCPLPTSSASPHHQTCKPDQITSAI